MAGESIRNPGRESIVLLEKLEAATSTTADPLAGASPLTKQDKAAERLVRRLNERSCRRSSSQSMSEMWRLSKSASLESWRQNPSSPAIAASRSPSVVAASVDECTAASSSEA